MKELRRTYITLESYLFPMLEEEIGELTQKQQEFVRALELIRPDRFIGSALRGCGFGRPMRERENILNAFILKAVYNLPTTKGLIENLKTNPSLRRLCGWEYRNQVPSEATFSRVFAEFAKLNLTDTIHEALVTENFRDHLVGHCSIDSTSIQAREKYLEKKKSEPEPPVKKKRGRKSKAELAAMTVEEIAAMRTRRIELQNKRSLADNLADLPIGCDSGVKKNSQGKLQAWRGHKLHFAVSDSGVPLGVVLSSASLHDSQVAIPLLQMVNERVGTIFYDLMDSAYDAKEIKAFSRGLGHVPIIEPNKRSHSSVGLAPAEAKRYGIRTVIERANSELKDNYGARHIRVKGHAKIFSHLMFGIIAITVKQLFNILC